MPTITDQLDSIFEMATSALIDRCTCDGGRLVDYTKLPRRIDDGDRTFLQYEMIRCHNCDGSGVVRSTDSPEPYYGSIGSALALAVHARDGARFGEMNEALDWGMTKYLELLALLQASGLPIEQSMNILIERAAKGRELMPPPIPASGDSALTEDELAELLADAEASVCGAVRTTQLQGEPWNYEPCSRERGHDGPHFSPHQYLRDGIEWERDP